ncbi:MAG TPA: F0F1 ATP synthase subunit delta [Bacillota bacterium]|nr:F0F1 ATP synthase subunit delta [Bacillota bacterium]
MSIVVAKRYADALFQLGQEKLTLDKFMEEFAVVREVFAGNEQLNKFLTHPGVSKAKKKQLIQDAFQGLQKDVVNTIKLLVERHHTAIIPAVIDEFSKMVKEEKGIVDAQVYSVRPLTDDEKLKLQDSLAKKLNKNALNIINLVDPTLIGGVKIRVGNTIYDGSISGKLKRIERNIVTANI